MEPFAFHPELFELRNLVLETLADHGFAWLSHFGAIDLVHDCYGIEVCSIREESDARTILEILRKTFPSWRHERRYYKDGATLEPGWKVVLSRDAEDFRERWKQES